ncbi:MAG TPA: sigma-70 family RNA polymerase sigma factor [Herpetosiphonaceae bacterium]|nr:sigma-70 family RNA polymerase sigma factor [Herpetosiphonaceae bacterium]
MPAPTNLTTDGCGSACRVFTATYQQYGPRLFAFFYQHVRHRQDAEDLTAITFSKVLRSIERYTEQGCFEAWLWSIARHTLADAQRRRREAIDIEQVAFRLIDPTPPPEAQVLQTEQVDLVRQLLRELPPDQRQVLLLRFFREWSFHEIAGSLGRSIGAVKMLVQRALATLRTRYPQLEHLQFDGTTDPASSARDPGMTNMTFRLTGRMVAVMHVVVKFRWCVPQPLLILLPAVVPVGNAEVYVTRRSLR